MSDRGDKPAKETTPSVPPALADVVRAGVLANQEVDGSIAVGGTICALYAGHRISLDVDFVVPDLEGRFQQVREHLLSLPAWKEARVRPRKLILGKLGEVEIGFRQQIRPARIETQTVSTPEGILVVPTLDEMLRIKSVLAYDRNAMRDFIDLAELATVAGHDRALNAVGSIDEKYKSVKQPSIALEVAKTLAACEPIDAQTNAYSTFRFLSPKLKGWEEVKRVCQSLGNALALKLLE